MAHLIYLNQLDEGNTPKENKYIPTLINLDSVDYIEPSSPHLKKTHSLIKFKWGATTKVKESLKEILELSKKNSL